MRLPIPSPGEAAPNGLPVVSIVTPTFQRGEFLEGTIRSVRAQTYPNIEHVVVDGGSTDATLDVLHAYQGSYNLRWISEPDQGMYDAVNKGIRMTIGEIVAYLNSDDLYFPWSVQAAVDAFAAYPAADFAFGDTLRVDSVRGWTIPVFVPMFSPSRSAAWGTLSQPATFWRRTAFDELGGFDESLRYVADGDFWFRAAETHRMVRIPEFVAVERWHAGALSTTGHDEMSVEDRRMRSRYLRGIWKSAPGRLFARTWHHVWSAISWARFVLVTKGLGTRWRRTVDACGISVSAPVAIRGIFPSRGSRLRSRMRLRRDPIIVASGLGQSGPLHD
jgi:glycosyltransferase involved in cell wall biosynthesis